MKNRKTEDRITIDISEITPKGSLGLLAYGDIAFKAWREVKINSRKKEDEKK